MILILTYNSFSVSKSKNNHICYVKHVCDSIEFNFHPGTHAQFFGPHAHLGLFYFIEASQCAHALFCYFSSLNTGPALAILGPSTLYTVQNCPALYSTACQCMLCMRLVYALYWALLGLYTSTFTPARHFSTMCCLQSKITRNSIGKWLMSLSVLIL